MPKPYESALVTGGTGFIGSHLCEALVERNYHVTIVDNLANSTLDNIKGIYDRVEFFQLDIRSSAFRELVRNKKFPVIFHFAANAYVPPSVENPEYDFHLNLFAPFYLLETLRCARLKTRLILASSAAVYGNPQQIPIPETTPTVPISPYGVSKLTTERYAAVYSQVYGLHTAALRLFSVYGPRQHKQIVYDFVRKLSANHDTMEILGDGTQVRDMVFVEDVVRAALLVLDNAPMAGEVYNVATGVGWSTLDIAETVSRAMHLQPKFNFTGSIRPGDSEKWIASIDRIKALGFRPEVSLEAGIGRIVAWYNTVYCRTLSMS